MIQGCDLSHNNSIIWENLSPNIKFVYCKASQGHGFKDPMFNSYWQHLKSIETQVHRGCYHFLTATDSAKDQADNFLSCGVNFSSPGCLPPMLDFEDQVPASLNVNITKDKAAFIKLITDWINIVQEATKRTVITYSYRDFFASYLNDHSWPNNPLWLAAYQNTPPHLPKGYSNYLIWQNSERGKLSGELIGGEIDMDIFNGTQEQLNELANIKSIV